MLTLQCPNSSCNASIAYDAEHEDDDLRCPYCDSFVVIPHKRTKLNVSVTETISPHEKQLLSTDIVPEQTKKAGESQVVDLNIIKASEEPTRSTKQPEHRQMRTGKPNWILEEKRFLRFGFGLQIAGILFILILVVISHFLLRK